MSIPHPLSDPILGLAPYLALSWSVGPDQGKIFAFSKKPLDHQIADAKDSGLRIDVITDHKTLFSVGYGIGTLFEDECYDPCSIEDLQKEAVLVHLHQICAFIASGIDPLPYVHPLHIVDKNALNRYVAHLIKRPISLHRVEDAVTRLITHLS